MAVGKEIRDQIKSVQSTQKITSAMEMVAASKMRKAQDRMTSSRPYNEKITTAVQHMAQSHSEYKHPFMVERELKRVGVILISSDRGLCGGLNTNLFREILKRAQRWQEENIELDFSVVGSKGKKFLNRLGSEVVSEVSHIGDAPALVDLIGSVKVMLDAFSDGKIDQLFVAFNIFENSMSQVATVQQVLPLPKLEEKERSHHWDYLYEPDAKEVMDKLLMRYIESIIYQSVVENIACEQSARMVAMKNATDNAGDLINDLQLVYNKARQTAITSELADIVGGAAAVN